MLNGSCRVFAFDAGIPSANPYEIAVNKKMSCYSVSTLHQLYKPGLETSILVKEGRLSQNLFGNLETERAQKRVNVLVKVCAWIS